MKDITEGIKTVIVLAIVVLAFEYSAILGFLSLIGVGVLVYILARKRLYINDPQLRPWVNYKKFEKEQKQINNKLEENYCKSCGVKTPKNSRFCINCGVKSLE